MVLVSAAVPRTLGSVGLRKIARAVRQANVDAELARRTATSAEFRKAVAKDRRGALSRYATVREAIRDRERIAAANSGERGVTSRSTTSRPKTPRNGSTGKKRG